MTEDLDSLVWATRSAAWRRARCRSAVSQLQSRSAINGEVEDAFSVLPPVGYHVVGASGVSDWMAHGTRRAATNTGDEA
jgi:hypothetical protein